MFNRSKITLSAIAMVTPLVTVICIIITSIFLAPLCVDTGQTIPLVKTTLAKVTELRPTSLDDPELLRTLGEALKASNIATLWLIGTDGQIVWAAGSTAESTPVGSTVETLATDDTKRIISALPQEILNQNSRLWLLAASAIRREGEHNDIYRHLLCPIQFSQNNQTAILGVAYLASAAKVGWIYKCVLLIGIASLISYWLSLTLWVFLDAKEHGDRAIIWAAFVLVGNLVALMAYILTRPPQQSTAKISPEQAKIGLTSPLI
jgi:hypothetical protein